MFELPILDLQDKVSEEEWQLRIDLAACYRLAYSYGWDDTIYTHISARLPGKNEYLVNAFGLAFDEITASNLVKVNLQGEVLDNSPFQINPAGFTIHSAIHEVREDAHCVIHLHTNETIVVSSLEEGLQPICQHAMFPLNSLAYHKYEGLAVNSDEKIRLQQDLGSAHTLMLPNHGALTLGPSVGEAFMRWADLQRACEVQVMALSTEKPLIPIAQKVLDTVKIQQNKVHTGSTGGQVSWPAMLRKAYRLDPSFAK
ncbi:class II aldolase/adducin family protein [Pseudoalteromonas denitrificans]|uniref:Ribulose-5-phosphate 4-epimerase/Fuculose-1-phosphate aldolase n=1 Tax=Pseudoalteromonas denitrificans DSM 6059 TaxID=1123010 RepID=A0A1I1JGD4_9GAMM|nr:class II aldolase/adducin family protein [Pseudoalteromonas denitrificans]SFC45688.1 Ribulose-5-phosphate 4-epimerase/Fuculose-1-phosphate aldolase [Pseudoalteromonas denitrificans DSM 6059]